MDGAHFHAHGGRAAHGYAGSATTTAHVATAHVTAATTTDGSAAYAAAHGGGGFAHRRSADDAPSDGDALAHAHRADDGGGDAHGLAVGHANGGGHADAHHHAVGGDDAPAPGNVARRRRRLGVGRRGGERGGDAPGGRCADACPRVEWPCPYGRGADSPRPPHDAGGGAFGRGCGRRGRAHFFPCP